MASPPAAAQAAFPLPAPARQPLTGWIVAAVLALLIGPQWLVMRDLFDGATASLAAAVGNPDGLYFWLSNGNWVMAVLYLKFCFGLADLLGVSYQVIVKLTVTGMLLSLYANYAALARRLFSMEAGEARLVGLLCLASPSIYIFVNSCAVPILLCVWLAFLGHRLFWHERLGARLLGLALLAASFQLNSNLVFILALDVVHLWRFRAMLRERLMWFVALLAVAVAVYASMRLLMPPRQIFVEYNQLLNPLDADSLRRMLRAIAMFLTWGVIPLSALAVGAVLMLATRARAEVPAGKAPGQAADREAAWFQPLAAVFLCAAAAFPYVMVGKGPPLFAYLGGGGSGLTEQVLRASHEGLFAPTWANTSARHGLLWAVPLALLTWLLLRMLLARLHGGRPRVGRVALFAAVLPLFAVWVLPAYVNKLQMQYAEVSLGNGLRKLPPAPAGVVDLHYAPASDWLIWSNAGTAVLRDAWGRSHYYAMFHSVPVYRDDLQWQYHVYFKNPGGMKSPMIQRSVGMDGFPGEDCQTFYEAELPRPGLAELLAAGFAPAQARPADVRMVRSLCQPGQVLPNPTPGKKAIL